MCVCGCMCGCVCVPGIGWFDGYRVCLHLANINKRGPPRTPGGVDAGGGGFLGRVGSGRFGAPGGCWGRPACLVLGVLLFVCVFCLHLWRGVLRGVFWLCGGGVFRGLVGTVM